MTTALAIRDEINLEQLQTLGGILCKTGFFTETREAGQAVAKILAGRELGFPAIASMTGVNIIKGRVTLSANLMAAKIKSSVKYNYRIRKHDDEGCGIEFFEDGESVGFSIFTRDDAQKAGLMGGDNWKKYFRNMTFARAISNGAKWYCADLFSGIPIYTPEELGAVVDGDSGDVIDMPAEPTIQPEPEPTTVEAEPTEAEAERQPTPTSETPMTHFEAIAELRHLNSKLGYDDAALVKWLTKAYKLDKGLDIHSALASLGGGELSDAIDIFTQHVEAAKTKAKGAKQ